MKEINKEYWVDEWDLKDYYKEKDGMKPIKVKIINLHKPVTRGKKNDIPNR